MVPLASGFGGIERLAGFGVNRRLIERIEPPAPLWIGGFGIVLKLKFRPGGPGSGALVGDVEHDTTVAPLRDVVVQLQLEPVVLVFGAEISGVMGVHAGQNAVLYLPARLDGVALKIVPAFKVFA